MGIREELVEGRAKILIIDDDVPTLEFLIDLFSPKYFVTTERNAIAGLKDLECGQYDVLLLDLDLPGLSGGEALARVRSLSNCRDLSIVLMSAYGGLCQQFRESSQRVEAVLSKPFKLDDLERIVEQLLRRSGQRREYMNRVANGV